MATTYDTRAFYAYISIESEGGDEYVYMRVDREDEFF